MSEWGWTRGGIPKGSLPGHGVLIEGLLHIVVSACEEWDTIRRDLG